MNPNVIFAAVAGFAIGLMLGERRYSAALERLMAYGSPAKTEKARIEAPDPEPEERIAGEIDEALLRPPTEESITKGAEYLLVAAAEAGISLTAEEAREQARTMLMGGEV